MRIAYVIPNCNPAHGGEQRDAVNSACALAALKQDVSILTLDSEQNQQVREFVERHGVRLIQFPNRTPNRNGPVRRDASAQFIASAHAYLSEQRHAGRSFDVIESFTRIPLGNFYRAAGGTRRAYISSIEPLLPSPQKIIRCSEFRNRKYYAREAAVFNRPLSAIIANSQRTRAEIQEAFPHQAHRIKVAYPAVERGLYARRNDKGFRTQVRKKFSLTKDDFVVCFVGSGFLRKGLGYAIETIALMQRLGVSAKLLVAGRDRHARFRSRAARLGVSDRIVFINQTSNVEEVYAASNALILPSCFEPFGLAAAEALCWGLPVVTAASIGLSEVISEGDAGCYLPEVSDVDRAAYFLAELAGSPPLRSLFLEKAERMTKQFSLESYGRRLLEVYQSSLLPEETLRKETIREKTMRTSRRENLHKT